MVPGGTRGSYVAATASCRAGSNTAPVSSRRGKPRLASTPWACCRTAWIPSTIVRGSAAACSSARSRLSTTGSHCLATWVRASASARSTWAAHRLRRLSRSARARSFWSSASASRACRPASRAPRSASRASRSATVATPPAPPPPSVRPVPCGPVPVRSAPCGPVSGGPAPGGPVSEPKSCWACGGSPPPRPGCDPPVMLLIGGELGVDHVIVITARGAGLILRGGGGGAEAVVDLLELGGEVAQPVQRRIVHQGLPRVSHQRVRPCLLVHGHRIAEVREQPFHLVRGGIQRIACVGQLAQPPVLVAVPLGIRDHLVDFGLVQVGGLADRDPLLGAGVLVLRRDVQDPVRVDVEGDLDLRLPPRGRPDVLQPESAQDPVVGGAFPLALKYHHVDRGLVVLGGAERLGAPGGNRGVAVDDLGHDPAERFDAERQRSHVQQQDVLDLALDHGSLNRGT